jgi:hypothetical protein
MTPRDLLTDKEAADLLQASVSADEIQPVIAQLVANGYPYNEHLTKANEQKSWLDKSKDLFNLK